MSHSVKQSLKELMGNPHHHAKIKSYETKTNRGKIRQKLGTADLHDEDSLETLDGTIDVMEHDVRMEHKIVGSIDIHEKARRYSEAHHVDKQHALNAVHHCAVGK